MDIGMISPQNRTPITENKIASKSVNALARKIGSVSRDSALISKSVTNIQ